MQELQMPANNTSAIGTNQANPNVGKYNADTPDSEQTTGACIRCGCTSEGENKSVGFVCSPCDEKDGDITGERNRIDDMPDVQITGFWRGARDKIETYSCKIGEYYADLNDAEASSDESIFFYFSSEHSILEGASEFVVTSYMLDEKEVKLTPEQLAGQLADDPAEVFFQTYFPIENKSETACFESGDSKYGFETFGEDLDAVLAADPRCVWTVIDSEISDGMVLVNGMRICNRIFYVITEKQWPENAAIAIRLT